MRRGAAAELFFNFSSSSFQSAPRFSRLCRLLAICLLLSEAIFAGHSGYRRRPTLCRDAAGTRSPPSRRKRDSAGAQPALLPATEHRAPGRWLRGCTPDAKFLDIFFFFFCSDSVASPSFDHHFFITQEMTWKAEESNCAKIKFIRGGNLRPAFSLTGQNKRLTLFLPRSEITVIPTSCGETNRTRQIYSLLLIHKAALMRV